MKIEALLQYMAQVYWSLSQFNKDQLILTALL